MKNTQRLVISAFLIALSMLIPVALRPIAIQMPPFTATLASHVPLMIAIYLDPKIAIAVSFGSMFGFFIAYPGMLVVPARAIAHVMFAIPASYMIKHKVNIVLTILVSGIIHAVFEMLVILIPMFYPTEVGLPQALTVMGVGTFIHHFVDVAIAISIIKILKQCKFVK